MNLTTWSPFREIEEIFDRYNRRFGMPSQEHLTTDWSPAVDIAETKKEFLIDVELPDVKKEDVKVTLADGVLNIEGERRMEKEYDKDKKHHRIERFYGRFERFFTLPNNVKESDIKAEFKDGMLKIRLEKTASDKPKAIEVEVAA